MPHPNEAAVVVITGASSGIGRATAHAFAKRGASVVLAARRLPMLEEAARECEALGGKALAVQTDAAREDQVEELGRRAVDSGGAPLAALPIDVATFPFRMADIGLTAAARLLETVAPAAKPGPESK